MGNQFCMNWLMALSSLCLQVVLLQLATFLGLNNYMQWKSNLFKKWSFSDKYRDFYWSSRHNLPWTSCATFLVLLWFLSIARQCTWYQLSGLIYWLIDSFQSGPLNSINWLTNWLTDQLNDSLDVWPTDWLICWLT